MRAPIEGPWTAAIVEVLPGCGVQAGDACTVLAESRSRPVLPLPATGRVGGSLVLDRGDVNLTFKRYLQRAVRLVIEDDHVTDVIGDSPDTELMRCTFAAWGERAADAVSHVGWGLNRRARGDVMAFYDKGDFNGTEPRASAGSFLYATATTETAGRHTLGHFDLPLRGCTVELDGQAVVRAGVLA